MSSPSESADGGESPVYSSQEMSGSSEYVPSGVGCAESSCHDEEAVGRSVEGVDSFPHGAKVSAESQLPERLFASDRFPSDGKINAYSKIQYLIDIVEILGGTAELDVVLKSQFGSLFRLQTSRCSMSGKLVHNLLCRQLISHNKHDAWFTFGGHPIRFSISEFEKVTGLLCGPLPDERAMSDLENVSWTGDSYWETLFGEETCVVIADLVEKLKTNRTIPGWKRLRLVLLVIVEGVLLCGTQPVCASRRVVEMLRDLPSFLSYPRGRESFSLTLRRMKVGYAIKITAGLISKLKQTSVAMHGFPLAIQLVMFEAIPSLLTYLPRSDSVDTFLDQTSTELPLLKTFHTGNILLLEVDPKVCVISRVARDNPRYSCDVPCDRRITFMEECLDKGMHFTKGMWLGGDSSLSPLCVCSTTKSGRCTCGQSSSVPPIETTSPVCSPPHEVKHCTTCEELKAMVRRLEAGQAAQSEILRRTMEVWMEKVRDTIVKEVVEQVMQRTISGRPCCRKECSGVCLCGLRGLRVEDNRSVGVENCGVGEEKREAPGGKSGGTAFRCDQPVPVDQSGSWRSKKDVRLRNTAEDQDNQPMPSTSPTVSTRLRKGVVRSRTEVLEIGKWSPKYGIESTAIPGDAETSEIGCKNIVENSTPRKVVTRQRARECGTEDGQNTHRLSCTDASRAKRAKLLPSVEDGEIGNCGHEIIAAQLVSRFKSRLKRYKKRVYDLGGIVVPRNFFTQLMSPQEWLMNTHMDLLVRALWKRCGDELLGRHITVTDCYFTQYMTSFYEEFLKSAPGKCKWPNMLRSYVLGSVPDREGLAPWGSDIHSIYAPMNWGCKHWVALFINLRDWEIEILDPLLSATPRWKVSKHMAPVAAMLPHLLKEFCVDAASAFLRPGPFKCTRTTGVSENLRTGDCGPLVVNFIDLHSHGLSLVGITDDMVDALRIAYAVNVYSEFVCPIN